MRKPILVVLLWGLVLILAACGTGGGPTASPTTPTPALIPTATPVPPPKPLPTPAGPFLPVGYVAQLEGEAHGVAGQARVVADRQVLIKGFSYDGKGDADIRLARQGQLDQPLAILLPKLEGAYQNSALVLAVPPDVEPGAAQVIAVYSSSEGRAYAVGVFQEGQEEATPPPPPTPTGAPFESPVSTPES